MTGFEEVNISLASIAGLLKGLQKRQAESKFVSVPGRRTRLGEKNSRSQSLEEPLAISTSSKSFCNYAHNFQLVNQAPARKHYCIQVRHARSLVAHYASLMQIPTNRINSRQLRAYLCSKGIYAPTDPESRHFFTSDFPTPDVIITYTWSSPLEVILSALEEALTPHEFRSFNLWLDVFCLHQDDRDISHELLDAQTLYASAQRHLVVAAAGQGINLLTRAWCCFELAVRMRGLGFASPPQLVATRSAEDTTSSSHTDYPSSFGSLPIPAPPVPVAGRRAGIKSVPISTQVVTTIGMAAEASTGGTMLVSKTDTVAVTDTVEPFTMVDPAEQLAKLLASRPPPPPGEKRSFLSIMEATVPQDLVQIRAEVLRVFRTSECFDDMLLAVVEADEVAWLASQLPIISQEGRHQIRFKIVTWVVQAYRPQLPKVEPDLYIMALLLYLEKLGISHQIITRVQSLAVRGPSAFDWRNLHLPPDVKRAAATEVRSTSLSWNSFSAGPPEGGDDGMNEVDKGSRLRTLGRANTMVTMWRGAGEDRQLSGRRTCRQVWLQFLAGAL